MSIAPKPSRPSDPAALLLGYLNFSAGAFDPAVWRACSDLFAAAEPDGERADSAADVAALLRQRLAELEATEPAFRDAGQARALIGVVFDEVLPGYRRFHSDLLEHQPAGALECRHKNDIQSARGQRDEATLTRAEQDRGC